MPALQLGPSAYQTLDGAPHAIDIVELALLDTFTSTLIAVNGGFNTVFGPSALFEKYVAGDVIRISGFVTTAGVNNGRYYVLNKTDDGTTATLFLHATTPVTEAAGPSVTISRLKLPAFVRVLTAEDDASVRPWGMALGTPPLEGVNMLLAPNVPEILYVVGADQIAVDGTVGPICVTSLANSHL